MNERKWKCAIARKKVKEMKLKSVVKGRWWRYCEVYARGHSKREERIIEEGYTKVKRGGWRHREVEKGRG